MSTNRVPPEFFDIPEVVIPGLDTTEPGHKPVERWAQGKYEIERYISNASRFGVHSRWICQCGWEFQGSTTKAGGADARLRQRWEGHLDSVANDTLIINMATVNKARSVEHIQVIATATALATGFVAGGSYAYWKTSGAWAIVSTTTTKNTAKHKIHSSYSSRDAAVAKALIMARKAQEKYPDTVIIAEGTPSVTMKEETRRLFDLADKAIETEDLHDIEAAFQHFEEFDRLLPLIRQRRDAIHYLRSSVLLKHR